MNSRTHQNWVLTPRPYGGRVSRVAKGGENVNRRLVAGLTALVLGGLIAAPAAPAATTVGQLFQPSTNCTANNTRLQAAAQSGTSYTIPAAGVLTSWSFQAGVLPLSGLKFKLAQPLAANQYRIVAETVAGPQVAAGVNITAARIAVQPGQLIGIYYSEGYCGTIGPGMTGDVYAARDGDQLAGTTASYGLNSSPGGRIPVQAMIEPDADKDGFGDETQDKCVGVAGPDAGCAVKCKKKKKKKSSAGAAKKKKKKCKKKKKKK
jgi:hypothetical protein